MATVLRQQENGYRMGGVEVIRIFISFGGEDAELAEFLSLTLNHMFQGHARFFASAGGMEPGAVWLNSVKREIATAEMVLMLLSPRSFDRPWINIEAGAFWVSDKQKLRNRGKPQK
jgi:hypothetical protein